MNTAEKIQFVSQQSDATLDTFFQIRPVTDVHHEGAKELYLQGLSSEALFTSYQDVLQAMQWLRAKGVTSWCDLGCGVGRTTLLWSWLYPEAQGIGIELVPERLEEARASSRTKGLANTHWVEADFASPSISLPDGDAYFIYLSTGPALDALLDKIKKRARPSWVVVIESHADLKPRLQWESWWLVPQAQRFPLQSRRHDPWVNLYQVKATHPALRLEQSWEGRQGLLPEELSVHPAPLGYLLSKSFQRNWEVVVEENGSQWTMDTLGLRWHDSDAIQGQFPPRQFTWKIGGIGLRRLPEDIQYRQFAQWRREETLLSYETLQGENEKNLKLRKIYAGPEMRLEFSNGRQIPVNQLAFLRPTSL